MDAQETVLKIFDSTPVNQQQRRLSQIFSVTLTSYPVVTVVIGGLIFVLMTRPA